MRRGGAGGPFGFPRSGVSRCCRPAMASCSQSCAGRHFGARWLPVTSATLSRCATNSQPQTRPKTNPRKRRTTSSSLTFGRLLPVHPYLPHPHIITVLIITYFVEIITASMPKPTLFEIIPIPHNTSEMWAFEVCFTRSRLMSRPKMVQSPSMFNLFPNFLIWNVCLGRTRLPVQPEFGLLVVLPIS